MDPNARNPIKATRTTFRIVEELVDRDGASVSELAAAMSFTKGTIHNHLATLRELGYATKTGSEYHVGLGFLFPAERARERTPFTDASMDPIAELAETTGQRVDLVVRDGHRVVLVHSECGDRFDGPDAFVGTSLPLHCSAPGKAVLAHLDGLSPEQALELATSSDRTDQTVTDPDRLGSELEHIREEGLAYDRGELHAGIQGIAAPLLESDAVRGAVGVLGSDEHMRGKTFQQDIPGLVLSAAERLAKDLRDF